MTRIILPELPHLVREATEALTSAGGTSRHPFRPSPAARPDVEGDRRGGRGVERLDAGRHGDPPPLALRGVGRAGPGPSTPTTRPKRRGNGASPSSGPAVASAISGTCRDVEVAGSTGPDSSGTWNRAGPAARLLLGWNGWAASRSRTTRATPNAAAERITAPTFSGSWNGTNSVQPSGQGSSSDQAGIAGTRTSSSGECVPGDVELLEERVGQPDTRSATVGRRAAARSGR